jgi:hypothetical protein
VQEGDERKESTKARFTPNEFICYIKGIAQENREAERAVEP